MGRTAVGGSQPRPCPKLFKPWDDRWQAYLDGDTGSGFPEEAVFARPPEQIEIPSAAIVDARESRRETDEDFVSQEVLLDGPDWVETADDRHWISATFPGRIADDGPWSDMPMADRVGYAAGLYNLSARICLGTSLGEADLQSGLRLVARKLGPGVVWIPPRVDFLRQHTGAASRGSSSVHLTEPELERLRAAPIAVFGMEPQDGHWSVAIVDQVSFRIVAFDAEVTGRACRQLRAVRDLVSFYGALGVGRKHLDCLRYRSRCAAVTAAPAGLARGLATLDCVRAVLLCRTADWATTEWYRGALVQSSGPIPHLLSNWGSMIAREIGAQPDVLGMLRPRPRRDKGMVGGTGRGEGGPGMTRTHRMLEDILSALSKQAADIREMQSCLGRIESGRAAANDSPRKRKNRGSWEWTTERPAKRCKVRFRMEQSESGSLSLSTVPDAGLGPGLPGGTGWPRLLRTLTWSEVLRLFHRRFPGYNKRTGDMMRVYLVDESGKERLHCSASAEADWISGRDALAALTDLGQSAVEQTDITSWDVVFEYDKDADTRLGVVILQTDRSADNAQGGIEKEPVGFLIVRVLQGSEVCLVRPMSNPGALYVMKNVECTPGGPYVELYCSYSPIWGGQFPSLPFLPTVVDRLDVASSDSTGTNKSRLLFRYCNGGDLRDLCERHMRSEKALPEHFIWHLVRQLCHALRFLHYGQLPGGDEPRPHQWKPIFHRDIHHRNVFLHFPGGTPDDAWQVDADSELLPDVVLGDFGCAAMRADPENPIGWSGISGFEDCIDQPPEAWEDRIGLCHVIRHAVLTALAVEEVTGAIADESQKSVVNDILCQTAAPASWGSVHIGKVRDGLSKVYSRDLLDLVTSFYRHTDDPEGSPEDEGSYKLPQVSGPRVAYTAGFPGLDDIFRGTLGREAQANPTSPSRETSAPGSDLGWEEGFEFYTPRWGGRGSAELAAIKSLTKLPRSSWRLYEINTEQCTLWAVPERPLWLHRNFTQLYIRTERLKLQKNSEHNQSIGEF